jgi:DNA anti-recombination protein RmuC
MSRAYRIRVREGLKRVIRAHDRVGTQLELLEVLPAEQMAGLLAAELKARGFEEEGAVLVRTKDGVTVSVDPKTGIVTVEAEAAQEMNVEAEREGVSYDQGRQAKQVKQNLQEQLRKDLEKQADEKTAELQSKVTERLEGMLRDLRQELDQAVNRVTAEALKQKAAQMGQIKELTEDPETGSLTIVVEV